MNTLKSIIAGLALVVVCNAATANNSGPNLVKTHAVEKLTRTHAIDIYLDAMTQGKVSGLNDVLDKSATFNMVIGKKLRSFNKKQMLNYVKNSKNTEQNCTIRTSIIKNDARVEIVKVDMKYNNLFRSNYITIADTGEGWKIIKVYTVFS